MNPNEIDQKYNELQEDDTEGNPQPKVKFHKYY